MSGTTYNAAIYVRLSKEDGDKIESDSITNQKNLIREYLKSAPNINVIAERVDDGYSGVDFSRPAVQQMIQEIRDGIINCVIVKDLSRFGRNYIEVGKYIEQLFPYLGVRFISVNDNYDTNNPKSKSDSLIIPFKNLINDEYCRDISVKIRSQLEIKQKKGDFIGRFAVYGYLKDESNKSKIVVDEFASVIVQDIFRWKIDGMSQQGIANKLNDLGVLSPLEYKKEMGLSFATSFKTNAQAQWSPLAIARILKNDIYIGILRQGKSSTVNHKVKKVVYKSDDECISVCDAHEPIISKGDYEVVNSLLKTDTRKAPNEESVYIFSGILVCPDCNGSLVRKTVPANDRKYIYHVCKTNKETKMCSSHRISDIYLQESTFCAIKKHIENVINMESILQFIDTLPLKQADVQKIDVQLIKKKSELYKYNNLKISLYESLSDGVIDKGEYSELKKMYSEKCDNIEQTIIKLQKDIESILSNEGLHRGWVETFKKHKNIDTLTRGLVVQLVDKIFVYEDSKIEIKFKYANYYEKFERFIETVMSSPNLIKEVV